MFTALWLAILLVVLATEAWALLRSSQGDTISEHIWVLLCNRWFRSVLFALWFWLTWHFLIEPFVTIDLTRSLVEDVLITGVGFLVGFKVSPPSWRGNCGS